MINTIKDKLDSYLEFDSSELFSIKIPYGFSGPTPLIRIFGGAIRDSICGDKINDVDILVGSNSIKELEKVIISNGYEYHRGLHTKDLSSIYDMSVINEPHTFINRNHKMIQLIRPCIDSKFTNLKETHDNYKNTFYKLISNVDISCCGVSYDGKELYENYEGSIQHCLYKLYEVNRGAMMYNEKRISHRIAKFEERGWEEIDKVNLRDRKIGIILDKTIENIEFKMEYDVNGCEDIHKYY